MNEDRLIKRYEGNKDLIQVKVAEFIPDVDLEGQ